MTSEPHGAALKGLRSRDVRASARARLPRSAALLDFPRRVCVRCSIGEERCVVCVGRVARPYLLREDAQRSAGKLSRIPQHVVVAGRYV